MVVAGGFLRGVPMKDAYASSTGPAQKHRSSRARPVLSPAEEHPRSALRPKVMLVLPIASLATYLLFQQLDSLC